MLSGPRFDAEVAVGSYPSPAADGRDWKYCRSGLPSLSVKAWPISEEPTSPLASVTSEPSARDLQPGDLRDPATTSG